MALQDYNNTKKYTKYKRHTNNSGEIINAETTNIIQNDVSSNKQEINIIKDNAFEERVYTIFDNSFYYNAMTMDQYENGDKIDLSRSLEISFDTNTRQAMLNPGVKKGYLSTSLITSAFGDKIRLNDFYLIANQYIPIGASITYYIENINNERWPITANTNKVPMHLHDDLKYGFRLIAEFKANALNESPKLNGYAILYWDAQVEENYGLTNPDLQRFP